MKRNIRKLFAFLLSFAFVLSFAACGKTTGSETTQPPAGTESTTAEATTAAAVRLTQAEIRLALGDAQSAWDGTAANLTDEMKAAVSMYYKTNGTPVQFKDDGFYFFTEEDATVVSETTALSAETTTAAPGNGLPTANAEILAAYTAVMNKAKTDKPGFTKYMYQALPDSEKYKDSTTVKLLMGIVNRFMTTKEKAMKNPEIYAKNNGDMIADFPVTESDKGCMLTDTGAIKSASCEKLANGNYKITILLNNEVNAERYRQGMVQAPSNTGNMFVIFSKSDVEPILGEWYVTPFVKDTNLTMTFHGCKAELVYNPLTNQIITLDQVTHTSLEVGGTVVGKRFDNIKTELDMYYSASDFKY